MCMTRGHHVYDQRSSLIIFLKNSLQSETVSESRTLYFVLFRLLGSELWGSFYLCLFTSRTGMCCYTWIFIWVMGLWHQAIPPQLLINDLFSDKPFWLLLYLVEVWDSDRLGPFLHVRCMLNSTLKENELHNPLQLLMRLKFSSENIIWPISIFWEAPHVWKHLIGSILWRDKKCYMCMGLCMHVHMR